MLVSIFFIFFMLFMAIIAIGTSLLRGIFNIFLGRRNPRQPYNTGTSNKTGRQAQSQQSTSSGEKKRDKIFDKTEGEYVDFEEIKE